SSLGTVYKENVDYAIDYAGGMLIMKDGGDLNVGQTVTLWYQAYALYTRGGDYQIDAERSEIKRLATGDITLGETVYLDYTPLDKTYNEEVLANAVVEANGLVERSVDPENRFGADPALQAAATCRALEIICRTSATRELSFRRGQERSALVWIQLAETYARRSDKLLLDFHPPLDGPANPVHS
ncbi:MAG: hypothetical protein U9R56_01675, partial [candidate division Zixibacteria bacterium]|nr:hypothetical protein [candidate division Zixibacteria bacterium]